MDQNIALLQNIKVQIIKLNEIFLVTYTTYTVNAAYAAMQCKAVNSKYGSDLFKY